MNKFLKIVLSPFIDIQKTEEHWSSNSPNKKTDHNKLQQELFSCQEEKGSLKHTFYKYTPLGTGTSQHSYSEIPFRTRPSNDSKQKHGSAFVFCPYCKKKIELTLNQSNYYYIYNTEDFKVNSILKFVFFNRVFSFYLALPVFVNFGIIFLSLFFISIILQVSNKLNLEKIDKILNTNSLFVLWFAFFLIGAIVVTLTLQIFKYFYYVNKESPFLIDEKLVKGKINSAITTRFKKYPFINNISANKTTDKVNFNPEHKGKISEKGIFLIQSFNR
ncbi:MAG: hypothetical protein H6563_15200 [Lewinellaceae bacterium]|nr:hypothetical protein [Lewinellaceae bacterium]